MRTYHYERLDAWRPTPTNGWAGSAVGSRFEAGTSGVHYLEHWPFGPEIARHPASHEFLDVLQRTSLSGGTMLDFGCGNAVLRKLLVAAGLARRWRYVGVDINPANIATCERLFADCRFHLAGDGGTIPVPDRVADVVVASGVLEYLEDTAQTLSELRRVARRWVILCRLGLREQEPSAIYWQRVVHEWGQEEHCMHVFKRPELDALLDHAGLEVAWSGVSAASGVWTAPDTPSPLRYYSYLLRNKEP